MKNFAASCTECSDQTHTNFIELSSLLDSSIDVICSFDEEGRFLYASAATKALWGYDPEELVGTKYIDLVWAEDHPKTVEAATAITAGNNLTNFENRYMRKDGSLMPIVWSATWDTEKKVMTCIAKDATEKKRLEASLNKSMLMFESFMDNAPFVAWISDKQCQMRYMNALYLKSYGLTKEDIGKTLYDLFPQQIAVDYHMNNLKVLRSGQLYEVVESAVLPNGKTQLLKISKFPLEVNGADMVAGWAIDISEQLSLQEELTKSVERYQYANEATSDAIYDWDITSNKIYRGAGFEMLFGYKEKAVSLKKRLSLIHPDDLQWYKASVFSALRNNNETKYHVEYRFMHSDGSYREVVDKSFIIKAGGKAIRVIGAIQDVTETKRLQKKLIEQEKKSQREIVKSIIEAQEKERRKLSVELHDNVNQMLASCKLMLEFAKDNKESAQMLTEKSYQSLQLVIDEIRRISHDLNPSAIEDVGLIEALDQMAEKINVTGKLKIAVHNRLETELELFEQDKIAIYRIIQEQVNNTLKHAQAENVSITLSSYQQALHLIIEDDGVGFDMNSVKKGLGLRNIINRIEYYHGSLNFYSKPGKGCRFEISMQMAKPVLKIA